MALAGTASAQQSPSSIQPALTQSLTPLSAPDDTDAWIAQNTDLPLRFDMPEALQALRSSANDAASTARDIGNAGEEDENSSSRGAADDGAAASGLSYGGLSTIENETTLDGLSAQQSFRAGPRGAAAGGARGGSIYAIGALQSLRATTFGGVLTMFSAQYGGAGGAMRAETRAGSRKLHGSAEWISEESGLAATNPYSLATSYNNGTVTSALVKPAGAMNQFSLAAGLPVTWHALPSRLRKSVALFGALDAQLRDDKIVSSPADPEFFSLTAMQVALLGNRRVGVAATNSALNYLSSLTGTTSRSAYRLTGLLRADADVSASDHITLAFNAHRVDAVAGAALGQASDAVVARGTGSLGDSFVAVEAGSAHWEHRFTPRLLNELRGQVSHDLEYEQPRAPDPQEPAIGPGGLAPEVSIAPLGFAYGTPSALGRRAYPDELRTQLADTLHWRIARNLLTLGAGWSRVHDRIANVAAAEGSFVYDSGNTNGHDGGLVDWITDYTFNVNAYPNGGCPSIVATVHYFCFRSYTQGFGANATEFFTHEVAGFAEDALTLRDDLRVTLGARYDYLLLPLPQNPNSVLDSDLAAASITAQTSRFPEDRNNFGPRIALVWSPLATRSKLPVWLKAATMQAGYGIFFGRVPGATIRAALADTAMPATYEHIRITPTTITQCPQVTSVNQGFGYPCAFTSAPPAAVAQTTSATLFARNFRMPMVQRGAFTLETDIRNHLHLRASYALAYAKQLPATTDVNIAPSPGAVQYVLQGGDAPGERWPGLHTGETFVVPLYTQRMVLEYGAVTEVESNANAYYNAATLEAAWRSHGFYVRGSYTFSRSIDDGPLQSATPNLDSQFDPFANGYDKGLSSLQFPQRFAGELQYETRWQRGTARERRILSGWRAAAIATAGSGAPYSYQVFGGQRLSGGYESINGSGGATYLPTVGRNTLRLAPRGNVDLRLGRIVHAGQRVRLNLFAEAFNALNERNLTSLQRRAFILGTNNTIGSLPTGLPTPLVFQDAAAIATEGLTTLPFGTPSSSTTGMSRERRIQFGIRAQF
ncbi:hypothetical protein GOB94_07350 [Granulicella sp. 5B5]|uniref:TonB-dependent receptor n=1 Tax=Granulicella sp. 5B5 TaxID=1617967 RepID=UPI0015F4705E|nr:TonB-dependent receptor [Granulicella sp. 5B5]QMV18521.1 hypothetical protein GOB94_07350 [Granulicella sp. 5B5]